MRRLLIALLLCVLITAAAADDFGQSYDLFETYYAQSVDFINDNTGNLIEIFEEGPSTTA